MADTTAMPQLLQAAPPREAVALFALLAKGFSAKTQRRSLRAAEYFGRVAVDARALWGDKSELCVVLALLEERGVLVHHARLTTSVDDAAPFWLEAHRLVAECRRILNARLSANTCLVGRCFAVEEDFFARYGTMMLQSVGAVLTKEQKAAFSCVKRKVGYSVCMYTAYEGLRFAYPAVAFPEVQLGMLCPPLTGEERSDTHTFAIRCLGIMTAATDNIGTYEGHFAKLVCTLLVSNHLEQPFKAELTRAGNRPALQSALRARGALEDVVRDDNMRKVIIKKVADDLAKHGLRWCALPSCAKLMTCVFDFKQCSACKAVVYCSAEHAALHWTATHKTECASLKAAGTKPRSTADGGEGGAGAA